MIDCKAVAEDSNMIINGYAFTKEDKNIRLLDIFWTSRHFVLLSVCMYMQVINNLLRAVLQNFL